MEVVGGFVGFYSNEGVLSAVDCGEELVEVQGAKVGEELLGSREPFLPKGAGAANVVFPEARLGFVNAEGDRIA